MDKQFISFMDSFVKQYHSGIFDDIPKCKSLLLDHAKGEYKKEIRLVLQALELGCHTAILKSKDVHLTRLSLIKQIRDEYFINEEIASSLIDLLLVALRNYKPDTPAQKQTPDTKPKSASKPAGNPSISGVSGSNVGSGIGIASHIMVPIPAGTFLMGSPENEPGREDDETQHSVTLTRDFLMGMYPVTQGLYAKVMGSNPSCFRYRYFYADGEAQTRLPVENVNWYDAIVFCNKLSILEGLSPVYTINGSTDPASWGAVPTRSNSVWDAVTVNWDVNGYRLPTEAEWEYACRAETTTAYHTGARMSDNTGWFGDNSDGMPHEVGKKTPNAWGVYDMHGNVYEWVWDWCGESTYTGSAANPRGPATGSDRVARGGSWDCDARLVRSAVRESLDPDSRSGDLGFRVVRASN
jgi:formylglycine-generating enzyme required for sulfatase activity